jgi:hypothetical protein
MGARHAADVLEMPPIAAQLPWPGRQPVDLRELVQHIAARVARAGHPPRALTALAATRAEHLLTRV